MIQLKRCNYITGDPNELGFAVNDIIKFLENDGRNALLFTPSSINENKKGVSTSLKYIFDNKFTFDSFNQFSEIITNTSNLFRVDLLVFDFYHMKPWMISDYKKLIDELNIDHIIVAKEYHYKTSDDVNDFLIRKEYKDLNKSEVHITDNINKWSSTLSSLSVSYIRDKKIDNLFGDND
jgi:hypothetical protein